MVEPAVGQELVEHAPGEGAMRAAALEREIDRFRVPRARCRRGREHARERLGCQSVEKSLFNSNGNITCRRVGGSGKPE